MKHSRSLHQKSYPLDQLVQSYPNLKKFIVIKPDGGKSINFAKADAVKALNGALLAYYYQVELWDIPAGYLCPPVPGRADYVHNLADLLAEDNNGIVPEGHLIKGLDIGSGANLIYPILASRVYGWQMVGSDIDPVSIKAANTIVSSNPLLTGNIHIRHQSKPQNIFAGIIKADEYFAFCMCNPPFHQSAEQAQAGSLRKVSNLAKNRSKKSGQLVNAQPKMALNFAGQANELWCKGGELKFIQRMIVESVDYATQIGWFSSLVSKKENVSLIFKSLHQLGITDIKTVEMAQGQKISRFVAWRF